VNAKSQGRTRSGARELLAQALYQWQLTGYGLDELLSQFSQRDEFKQIDTSYFKALLRDILERNVELSSLIEDYADRSLDQLDPMGHAILLIGLAELKLRPKVPTKVVINEAIKLAKLYGATDGDRFVNALLDRAAGTLRE
jgi:N utilization substance protein B